MSRQPDGFEGNRAPHYQKRHVARRGSHRGHRCRLSTALPLCLGNFPQQVRDLPGLFRSARLSAPNPSDHPGSAPASLLAWTEKASWQKGHPHPLLAVATLRLAGDFEQASELLECHQKNLPKTWEAAWANETAALAWHRGQADEATLLWQQQADSIPVFFNRGLAALTAGRNEDALTALSRAVAGLPESDAWHHLGQLYLAMAQLHV